MWENSVYMRLFDRWRCWFYDYMIVGFTSCWYNDVLEALPSNARVLDVGIGTGSALFRHDKLLRAKNLHVVGVDYDEAYVVRCKELIEQNGLQSFVEATYASIYDYRPPKNGEFDVVYFSGSFMILPDKEGALRRVMTFLKDAPTARIFFTQTFELRRSTFLEWLKPKLKYWTSIDFGSVTYEEDFDQVLRTCNVQVVEKRTIRDGKEVVGARRSVLVEAKRGGPPLRS